MTHILQPEGSSLCGQCCVAMAAGVSLDRAIELIGHRGATDTAELRRALEALGVGCAARCRRVNRQLMNIPQRAILVIHTKGLRRGHWMLQWDGRVYDPGGAWPDYKGWHITSFLEIYS